MSTNLYAPLDENAREIRLIILAPGNREDEIQASLSTATLDDSHLEYEALSYVWGDPSITRPITLSGQDFAVTENLHAALRRLRFSDRDRVLWIDAICVNQADLPERNSQVHWMRDVYSKCKRCVIWLGEEDETTAEGVKFLEFAATDSHLREWPRFAEMAGPDESDEVIRTSIAKMIEKDPQCFEPLKRLMVRPWWNRMWTAQEFVLPKSVLILCGSFVIEWDVIVKAQDTLLAHYDSCCATHYYRALSNDSQIFASFWTNTIILQLFRREYFANGIRDYDLIDFLKSFRSRSSSDPRDKVYGILGLLSPHRKTEIGPNYELDTHAAYMQLIRCDIHKTRTLNMLGYVEDREENENPHHLPSWAPDWSTTIKWFDNQGPRIYRTTLGLYKACGDFGFLGDFPSDSVLSTLGVKYGAIAHVSRLIGGEESTFSTALEMKNWLTAHLPSSTTLDDVTFQRILLNDSYIDQGAFSLECRATAQHYAHCLLWWERQKRNQWLKGLEKERWKPFVNVESTISTNLLLRRFFVTEKGEIGVGPPRCKEGDEVWVLRGGKVPLVLRRVEKGEEGRNEKSGEEARNEADKNEPDESKAELHGAEKSEQVGERVHHVLMGEAFVDGIMDGEAAAGLASHETSTKVVLV